VTDTDPGAAIINETFAKVFFKGANPIGKSFDELYVEGPGANFRIVGVVHDSRYQQIRGATLPVAYLPFYAVTPSGAPATEARATFLVRTAAENPLALASALRKAVPQARAEFRVTNLRSQQELIEAQTVRERFLATLASFFSVVALLLASVGLYGVLHYSVLQRRREIGIRMAIGAQAGNIARLVTVDALSMVLVGAVAGLAAGLLCVRYLESLFYQVKPTDIGMLSFPALAIFAAALLAAIPPLLRAVRVDPMVALRYE
jgi:predicted lysophospholipase L1 biosynthesis ABC-type transport system permease subunit